MGIDFEPTEEDQVLMFIRTKGGCGVQEFECYECVLNLDCDPEVDPNIHKTRYRKALRIGLDRGYITEAEVFDEVL